MFRVFVDGAAGTTGLQLKQRLAKHPQIEMIEIADHLRKDMAAKLACAQEADLTVLCLPDEAAIEMAAYLQEHGVRVIDASSAHRVKEGWVYGFAELTAGQREKIKTAQWVSNPGCYPIGFLSLIRPLIERGILPQNIPLAIHGVSGYSGGGNQLIDKMEQKVLDGFCAYGLGLAHKHNLEMKTYAGLDINPIFMPNIGNFKQGMLVKVALQLNALDTPVSIDDINKAYQAHYADTSFIKVHPINDMSALAEGNFLEIEQCNNTNQVDVFVFHNTKDNQLVLAARLDNLGKGASGNVVQCINLMLGLDENLVPAP